MPYFGLYRNSLTNKKRWSYDKKERDKSRIKT